MPPLSPHYSLAKQLECLNAAKEAQKAGEEILQAGDHQTALKLLTQAVAHVDKAQHAGLDIMEDANAPLAEALSRRGDCYLRLQNPRAALADVECAIASCENLPGPLWTRLLDFQVKALVALNKMEAALEAVRRAVAGGIGEDGQHVARGLMRLLATESQKKTPARAEELFGALVTGQLAQAFQLLREGRLHVDERDAEGNTMLQLACELHGKPCDTGVFDMEPVVQTGLQEFGADPRQRLNRMRTPLMVAAKSASTPLAKLLVDAGAELNAQDADGNTALLLACEAGAGDMVKIFLDRGADVNHVNYCGWTALIYAATNQQLAIVEMLLAAGASLRARDRLSGNSVFSYACKLGYAKVSQTLWFAAKKTPVESEFTEDARVLAFCRDMGIHDKPAGGGGGGDRDEHQIADLYKLCGIRDSEPNPLLSIHESLMKRMPSVVCKRYTSPEHLTALELCQLQMLKTEAATNVLEHSAELGCWLVPALSNVFLGAVKPLLDARFSPAVPSAEALAAIGAHGPIVHLGAGTGYWAKLLQERSVDVMAYDPAPPPKEAPTPASPCQHTEVLCGGAEVLAEAPAKGRTLLLCAPARSAAAEEVEAWEEKALDAYGGAVLLYAGVWASDVPMLSRACSDQFIAKVEERFDAVMKIKLPSWPMNETHLTVWRRKA